MCDQVVSYLHAAGNSDCRAVGGADQRGGGESTPRVMVNSGLQAGSTCTLSPVGDSGQCNGCDWYQRALGDFDGQPGQVTLKKRRVSWPSVLT
jgi:hypothetical protein